MLGNDVVDLTDPEARPGATHPRFDARVFTPAELERLRGSGAPHRLRWMLWAAKEAAYKLLRKVDARTIFSPVRFQVALDATLRGQVRHGDRVVSLRLGEGEDSLHAIATDERTPESRILTETAELEDPAGALPGTGGAAARALAVEHIAGRLGVDPEELEIERRGRIPTLRHRGEETGLDLSLSHHGRFVAFACDLGEPAQRSLHP